MQPLTIGQMRIDPPLFLAPMAGVTHAPFRRLVADFGGYGALYTEMLSGSALRHEKTGDNPFTRIRPAEGIVFWQLLLSGREDIEAIIARIAPYQPDAIDINCACPAPEVKKHQAGCALFADFPRLERVLGRIREAWQGVLSVKCRLGADPENWEKPFARRVRLFERMGVDMLVAHPRFFGEKLRRRARWRLLPRLAALTDIPLVASGDIRCRDDIARNSDAFADVGGLMIGRMAAARPWIFRELRGEVCDVDYARVWERMYRYVTAEFAPEKAIGRMKQWSAYYARNFFFGHQLYSAALAARTLEDLHAACMTFLSATPQAVALPSVDGV
jgi:tRNA-dihydrouridine synthase